MSNMLEYIDWRGDLSFARVRPAAPDGIIFAMLSYIDYASIIGDGDMLFKDAAEIYAEKRRHKDITMGRLIPSKQINEMFLSSAKTRRFGNVRISDFKACTDIDGGYQFAAVTFHLPGGHMMVTFRGTDDSIVGWREDCCLAFLDEIPAQRMAVEYLSKMADKYPDKRIYISGHSKGGNLAIYSAVSSSDAVQDRIVKAFCGDCPGLSTVKVNSDGFKRMQRKLTVLIPQSSYIGVMFEKGERYTVVKSVAKGIFQHDPYTWVLDGPDFIRLDGLSEQGKKNEEQFRARMSRMSIEEKQELVETLFGIVESTGVRTLSEISASKLQSIILALRSYSGLERSKKNIINKWVLDFMKR